MRKIFPALCLLFTAAIAQAAEVFPVKAYTKPDEDIVVKFVNEKGPEGKKAVEDLGAAAAKLESLYTPAADAADFKLFSATGEELKLVPTKPGADGTLNLSAAYPALKDGGTFFLVWKDAAPLVIETLFNPGRGIAERKRAEARMGGPLPEDMKKQFAPVVTHMVTAQVAVITTDKGVIKAKFAYDVAPHTIDNFTSLARQNYYDGSAFHRIITGFMIQGGDAYANMPGQAGMGGPGYEIMKEFSEKKHVRGVLSMARSSDPNSAGSQFFIMHGANANLDGSYTAFGDVLEGMDVVDTLAKTPVSDNNGTVRGPMPKILSIKIVPATAENYGLKK